MEDDALAAYAQAKKAGVERFGYICM